MKFDIWVFFF